MKTNVKQNNLIKIDSRMLKFFKQRFGKEFYRIYGYRESHLIVEFGDKGFLLCNGDSLAGCPDLIVDWWMPKCKICEKIVNDIQNMREVK